MGLELLSGAAEVHSDWLAAVARATGGRAWEEDGLACREKPFEVVIAFPAAVDPDALDRVIAWCALRDLPTVGCWTLEDDPEVATVLATRGFREGWRPHWMALDLDGATPPAPHPHVAEERDVPEYDGYGRALLTIAGERSAHFVAREGGAWRGMAWLHAPGEVAGLFDLHVDEAHRRRGWGAALTWAACRRAAALGCRAVTLNATEGGERLYRALGFASLARGRTWWLRR